MAFKYKRIFIRWFCFINNIWGIDTSLFEEIMNIEFIRKINSTKKRAYEYVEENKHLLQTSVTKKILLFYLEDTLKVTEEYKNLGRYEEFMAFVNGVIDYKNEDEYLSNNFHSVYEELLLLAYKIKRNVINYFLKERTKKEDALFMS
ncbi:hypothetical protein UFOVP1478_30 [uncultured Caudovirales phage]|uniref:Uncharacterized protein n=1 Tax=uncultured Caudovirales phage TaxID=2100421 RepID=A0A6J5QJP7_9CAUD|nr:hypothetical protein UFOVP1112_39 [uncultured Caudovirales phage]CAB4203857.1 hypothetical protein UFOVP1385_12 [uncultured Caudovirales phage]CAB4215475.1 hypothetical protein UFOVP1478_30 [uncultured Caudovirales phage]